MVKTAFYLALGKALLETHGVHSHATYDYLEVYFGGMVFRLRIFVPREILMLSDPNLGADQLALLEAADSTGPSQSFVSKNPAVILMPQYRELVASPHLTSLIHNLHLKCPTFGPTARLAKRW